MKRPRKALISWGELLAWLHDEGVTRYDLQYRFVGAKTPPWRYPHLLLGRKRRRLYVVRDVAAWLVLNKKLNPQLRHARTGRFLCKD